MSIGKLAGIFSELSERWVLVILALAALLTRLPFLETFALVAYDGTYYLNQARTLLTVPMAGMFPIGYPVMVALFHLVMHDLQLAGQLVSLLAGLGSTLTIYLLAREFTRREFAFLGAVLLTLNPLFVRLSLMTLSESLYIFWLLLGLLLFVKRKIISFGLVMGAAAITRPEALLIAGLLGLTQIKKAKRLALAVLCFLAVYSLNSVALSLTAGHAIVLPKSEFYGIRTSYWKAREATLDFAGKDKMLGKLDEEFDAKGVAADYLDRLPQEVLLLGKHVLPAVFFLALLGLCRKRHLVLLPALLPFFVYPLVTVRSDDRYILPYIPILLLYAVFSLDSAVLRRGRLRSIAVGLLIATLVALPFLNRDALLKPESSGYLGMKEAGIAHRSQVRKGDRIADRKPFFAFYAGGEYLEIPVGPYNEVMDHLLVQDVKFLALHQRTIHVLRPALQPLLYDPAVIRGELRFRQTWFAESGETVFTRARDSDGLQWIRLLPADAFHAAPVWSPDGSRLAFRSTLGGSTGGIYVMEIKLTPGRAPTPAGPPRLVVESTMLDDPLAWSGDGRSIAYANETDGETNIFLVEIATGRVEPLTEGPGLNRSPALMPSGPLLAFSSERSGKQQIWMKDLDRGSLEQVTDGEGSSWPAFSPGSKWISWVELGRGLTLVDGSTRETKRIPAPRQISYAPSWSPDEGAIAVAAKDWGSWDIYLVDPLSGEILLVTKEAGVEVMPAWNPTGGGLTLCSNREGEMLSIWTLSDLSPYRERLTQETPVRSFR